MFPPKFLLNAIFVVFDYLLNSPYIYILNKHISFAELYLVLLCFL